MVHRRQAIDVVWLIAQLAGFIGFVSLFFPAVRRAIGFIAVCLSVLFVIGLAGFSLYRLATRWNKTVEENPFAVRPKAAEQESADQTWNDGESAVMSEMVEPGQRRRYPWRH